MIVDGKKRCAICKENLPVSNFYVNKANPNGLDGYCKTCRKAYFLKLKRRNPEYRKKQLEAVKKWQGKNKDKVNEKVYKYRKKNKDKVMAAARLNEKTKKLGIGLDDKCYFCNADGKIDKHHFDYDKVYEYIPLCRGCHRKHHYLLSITKI